MPRWRPGEPSTPACFPVSWLRNCYKNNGLTFQWISDSCGWLCNRCSAIIVKMSWTLHDIVTIASTQIAKATPHRFQCSNCSTELLLNVVAACSCSYFVVSGTCTCACCTTWPDQAAISRIEFLNAPQLTLSLPTSEDPIDVLSGWNDVQISSRLSALYSSSALTSSCINHAPVISPFAIILQSLLHSIHGNDGAYSTCSVALSPPSPTDPLLRPGDGDHGGGKLRPNGECISVAPADPSLWRTSCRAVQLGAVERL